MFKKIVKIYLLLSILLCSLISVGCKHTEPTPEETIIEIYCDYFNSLFGYKRIRKKDVKIRYYLGQYSDAYCAYIEGDTYNLLWIMYPDVVTIDGETFEFENIPEKLSVYYNNKYYTICTACDKGILTLEDVKALHEYCTKYIF